MTITGTIKTSLGFLVTLIAKFTPLKFENNSMDGIYNFHNVSETLSTSGQPTENQFSLIRAAGYKTVINLAPHGAENSLADESATLAALDIRYIHIPVDFKNPTEEDFKKFVNVMQEMSKDTVWIHCAANMRVSAFLYRYRCSVAGEDEQIARKDLEKIWEPFGVWKEFISKGSERYQ